MKTIIIVITFLPVILLRYLAEVFQWIIFSLWWLILKPFCFKKMSHYRNIWRDFKRGLRDII